MKGKYLALLLSAAVLLSLAACGGSDTSSSSSSASSDDAAESGDTDAAADSSQEQETADEIVFEGLTVADNEECYLAITGVDLSDPDYVTLDVEIENKSEDKTYVFYTETASVNGVVCEPYLYVEVTAGKKAVDEVILYTETLNLYGVGPYTDFEILFEVYDEADDYWYENYVVEETVHIYPYGEENVSVYEYTLQDMDLVIADDENVTVVITGTGADDFWDSFDVNFYLVNKTDADLVFSIEDASVNGYMLDPYWGQLADAGKCAFSTAYWFSDSLEEIGISDFETELTTVEFLMMVYDYDNYDEILNASVVLEP